MKEVYRRVQMLHHTFYKNIHLTTINMHTPQISHSNNPLGNFLCRSLNCPYTIIFDFICQYFLYFFIFFYKKNKPRNNPGFIYYKSDSFRIMPAYSLGLMTCTVDINSSIKGNTSDISFPDTSCPNSLSL